MHNFAVIVELKNITGTILIDGGKILTKSIFKKQLEYSNMKANTILRMAFVFGLLTGCQPGKVTDNPELLKKVLISYFEGIENKDFAKMKAVTTDDFILYEDGAIWNNDSAFMNIKAHLPFTLKYKFDNFKINVDNKSGDVTYLNHADFVFNNTKTRSFDWIESATHRKNDGVWKMNFLQATVRR
jgi:Domain of unknown function (DUF4440)